MCARRGYYWISDIADVEAKIKELKADPGSSKRLAEFRTERKKLVEDMTKVGTDLVRCLIRLICSFLGRLEI